MILGTAGKWSYILLRRHMVIPKHLISTYYPPDIGQIRRHNKFPYPEDLTLYWGKLTIRRLNNQNYTVHEMMTHVIKKMREGK